MAAGSASGATSLAPAPSTSRSAAPLAPVRPINAVAAARNAYAAAFVRTLMAVVVGAACGVLGVTGAMGFAAYAAQHLVVSAVLLQVARWRPVDFFPNASLVGFACGSLGDDVIAFLLFWTMAYALVHIY